MSFTWGVRANFAKEFERYPKDQQDSISDFLFTYQQFGLRNETKYPGKLSCSWANLLATDPNFVYAKDNNLWHYHIGLPAYMQAARGYRTSDWVLHFQWENAGNHIDLVDTCYHKKANGQFYLPSADYLIPIAPQTEPQATEVAMEAPLDAASPQGETQARA